MTRFRLSTLLFLTALIGMAFGWYQDRQRLEREIEALESQYNQAAIKAVQADIEKARERMTILHSRRRMFDHLRDVAPSKGLPVDQEIVRLQQQILKLQRERLRLRQLRLQQVLANNAK